MQTQREENQFFRKSLSLSRSAWSEAEIVFDSSLLSNFSSTSSSRKSLYSFMHNFLSKFLSFSSIICKKENYQDQADTTFLHLVNFSHRGIFISQLQLSSGEETILVPVNRLERILADDWKIQKLIQLYFSIPFSGQML